jgi:CheY-like chemotaxis protein
VRKENLVLVAEDNPDEALLLEMACKRAGVRTRLLIVHDGQDVIEYLSADPEKHPRPCLLLLDLKMPRLSGFDVLKWLQGQPRLRELPVLILSSSAHDSDVVLAGKLGARGFFTKPTGFEDSVELIRRMQSSWIGPHCESGALGSREPVEAF